MMAKVRFQLTLRKICQASVRQLKIRSDRVHVAKKKDKNKKKYKEKKIIRSGELAYLVKSNQ
jgi:hypothetical protein